MSRRDAKQGEDDKDPAMMVTDIEDWECHDYFPKTVLQFKQLHFHLEYNRQANPTGLHNIARRRQALLDF